MQAKQNEVQPKQIEIIKPQSQVEITAPKPLVIEKEKPVEKKQKKVEPVKQVTAAEAMNLFMQKMHQPKTAEEPTTKQPEPAN